MKQIGIPESERPELLAYLKNNYRYEDGGIVNRKTGRRRQGSKMRNGYLGFTIHFKGKDYCTLTQRIVWALYYNELSTQTIDHINGDRHDNHIENLREVSQSENNLNTLLPWRPNKDTGVAGVDKKSNSYRTNIRGRDWLFSNPYEAFYWAIACGKRYRTSPPDPSPKERGGGARR